METSSSTLTLIVLVQADLIKEQRIKLLRQECEEIIKILVAITKKIKQKIKTS